MSRELNNIRADQRADQVLAMVRDGVPLENGIPTDVACRIIDPAKTPPILRDIVEDLLEIWSEDNDVDIKHYEEEST